MRELTGLHRGDAAIVGGGLTGLLLASSLAQAGLRVLLLDTGECSIPPGTELATALCIPAYRQIEAIHGLEAARAYAADQMTLLNDLHSALTPYAKCAPAYLYARTERELAELQAQGELLQRLGVPFSTAPDAGGCPFPVELSLLTADQLLMDMPQWKSALLGNLRRHGGQHYRSCPITSLHSTKVCTPRGCLEAPHIIFAGCMPPALHRKNVSGLLERRSTLLCELRGPYPLHSIQQDIRADGLTLLPARKGATALWDAGHCGTHAHTNAAAAFEAALSTLLPDWQRGIIIEYDEIHAVDGLPMIGNLPGSRHLVATGSRGILGAMHAAAVLTRRILGQSLPEDRLYAPDRVLPRWFIAQQQRQRKAQSFWDLFRFGAPSCPHCDRKMRYCPRRARWDCPACGSAFDMLGQVVCGPAMRPAILSARQRPTP